MYSDRNKPIDYKTFKRRSRWRAFTVCFAFDAFLVITAMSLIYFGAYWR